MKDYEITVWNADILPQGYKILGLVEASAIDNRSALWELAAEAKNLIGLKIRSSLAETRQKALDELKKKARNMGADAIMALRYDVCCVHRNFFEVFIYGTAICHDKQPLDFTIQATSMENHVKIDAERLQQS